MFPSLKRKGTNAPRRVAVDRENSPSLRWINLQAGRLHTCRLKSWHTGRVSSNWKKMCQIILLRTPRDRSRAISYKEKEEGERKKKKKQTLTSVSHQNHTLAQPRAHSRVSRERRAKTRQSCLSPPQSRAHVLFEKSSLWTLTFKLISVLEHIHGTLHALKNRIVYEY